MDWILQDLRQWDWIRDCDGLAVAFGLAQANGKISNEIVEDGGKRLANVAASLHLRVVNFLRDNWTDRNSFGARVM